MAFPITVTDAAVDKAWSLLQREGREDLRLRIQVQPGGCSGLIYNILFDANKYEDDQIKQFEELEVIVDKMSAPYLEGATVDYADTLEQSGFNINNPNATGTCSCGNSFH